MSILENRKQSFGMWSHRKTIKSIKRTHGNVNARNRFLLIISGSELFHDYAFYLLIMPLSIPTTILPLEKKLLEMYACCNNS